MIQWKEILSSIVAGAIFGSGSLYLLQSNQITALQTEFNILKESSLDFKNNQKQLGEISVKKELLNKKELKLKKLELSLESNAMKFKEKELLLKIKNDKYNKLLANLKIDKIKIKELKQELSLTSRAENYMKDYLNNYSDIDRGITYSCDNKHIKFNIEYNNKVRKAKALLDAINNIGLQLEKHNEFTLFVNDENYKVNSYSMIKNCK